MHIKKPGGHIFELQVYEKKILWTFFKWKIEMKSDILCLDVKKS